MPNQEHPLWQSFLISSAIDYFNTRRLLPCLLVDNNVLQDGVLESHKDPKCNEFAICVAPSYVTDFEVGNSYVTTTLRFPDMMHTVIVPFSAIIAVASIGSRGIVTDDGHMNIIGIPPVIRAPGHQARANRPATEPHEGEAVIEVLEVQPQQEKMNVYRKMG